MSLQMLLLLALWLGAVSAHNFIASPSRAKYASTKKPFLPRRHSYPHAALGAGDSFQVEWMTGHSVTPTYFTLVRAHDAQLLEAVSGEILEEYIAGAPKGSDSPPAREFRKFHRKPRGVETYENDILDNHYRDNKGVVKEKPDFFKAVVATDDPDYLKRPAHFGQEGVVLEFKDEHIKNDRYVAYKSDKYPWIVSVQKYTLDALQPGRPDVAKIVIPDYVKDEMAGQEFLVNYWWRAYWDALDVYYSGDEGIMPRSTNITEIEQQIYGVPSGNQYFERVDHCSFPDMNRIATDCYEIVSSPRDCFERCNSEYGCDGVLIAPAVMPSTVYDGFKNDGGVPWGASSQGHHGDKNYTCYKEDFAHLKNDETAFICVGVKPRSPSQTFDIYETTNDPLSPDYYSSCYVKTSHRQFSHLPPPPAIEEIDWRPARRDLCVPCDEAALYANRTTTRTYVGRKETTYNFVFPEWNVTEVCVNCRLEPAAPVAIDRWQYSADERIEEADWIVKVADGEKCDGVVKDGSHGHKFEFADAANADSCSSAGDCWKRVHVPGHDLAVDRRSPDVFECAYAAKLDDDCGNHAVIVKNYYRKCFCRRANVSCCKECAVVSDSTRNALHIEIKK